MALAPAAGGRHSVHVHTDDAGAAIEAGLIAGTVTRIRISALATGRVAPRRLEQAARRTGRRRRRRRRGDLQRRGRLGIASRCRTDGPGRRVSAERLLRAVVDTGAAQVMVLPNGYVAAEDLVAGCTAAIGWGSTWCRCPAGPWCRGLAALAVHDPARHAVDDGYTMAQAAAGARHGSVRIATQQALTWAGACLPGDGLGISAGEVVVVDPDPASAVIRLIDLLLGSGGELVTVLIGAAVGPDAAEALAAELAEHVRHRHPGTEFSSYRTGHRGDLVFIGVE